MVAIVKLPSVPGFDTATLAAMVNGHIIEESRFPDRGHRALANYGEKHEAFFPGAEVLAERGFNIASIAVVLHSGCMSSSEVGKLVNDVANGSVKIAAANRKLFRLARTSAGKGQPPVITEGMLIGLGFDLDAVHDALDSGAITPENFGKLVLHVSWDWLSADNANSGLGHVYDNHMSALRQAA
jgi:hypothetical protein